MTWNVENLFDTEHDAGKVAMLQKIIRAEHQGWRF